jgi:peroxiredoxin
MQSLSVGQVAPSFRLPSGQGAEVSSEDYLGKKNLIVWFTKGMACPFCRQHMSQLVRGYAEFQKRDAEILEITTTDPARARLYMQNFPLPFPYLCDPGHRVSRAWTLGVRSHSPLWYAARFVEGARMPAQPPTEFDVKITAGDLPKLLRDDDMGFFIVDKRGVVRYALAGSYTDFDDKATRPIPSNEEIVRELDRLS